ncbi:MAG: hypothetical protein ABIG11_06615 [bacterium]
MDTHLDAAGKAGDCAYKGKDAGPKMISVIPPLARQKGKLQSIHRTEQIVFVAKNSCFERIYL